MCIRDSANCHERNQTTDYAGGEMCISDRKSDAGVKRIVYVSCNPSTMARDLKVLDELGYIACEIQPVDMFPHTFHVECVVLMSRVEK